MKPMVVLMERPNVSDEILSYTASKKEGSH